MFQEAGIEDLGQAFSKHGKSNGQNGDHHTREGNQPPLTGGEKFLAH